MSAPTVITVTISAGTATSTPFSLIGHRIAAVITPSAWDAADISFEVSDGAAWRKVVDSTGALIKITGVATATSEYMVPPESADMIVGYRARIVSTSTASEADTNQTAARTLQVVLAPVPG